MARQRNSKSLMDRPKQQDWVGLKQLDRWKREAAKPEYGVAAFKVINAAGKVTRQEYLEMMLDMEEKFPGYGWKENMDALEKYFADQGLSLKEKSLSALFASTDPEVQEVLDNPPF